MGGRNQSIRAYQRAENSGSQTALQALMADQPLMEPEQENRISAMDGIIRSVADYRNFSNAIGFSFRFYATELVTSQAIRLLALDGVYPTQETIRDGHVSPFLLLLCRNRRTHRPASPAGDG